MYFSLNWLSEFEQRAIWFNYLHKPVCRECIINIRYVCTNGLNKIDFSIKFRWRMWACILALLQIFISPIIGTHSRRQHLAEVLHINHGLSSVLKNNKTGVEQSKIHFVGKNHPNSMYLKRIIMSTPFLLHPCINWMVIPAKINLNTQESQRLDMIFFPK